MSCFSPVILEFRKICRDIAPVVYPLCISKHLCLWIPLLPAPVIKTDYGSRACNQTLVQKKIPEIIRN